jgi:hypothetical protein
MPTTQRYVRLSQARSVDLPQMKAIAVLIVILLAATQAAHATSLYWKIVDASGKSLGDASSDSTNVSRLEMVLQGTYPGIKLSIDSCRLPTLVEAMNPVYGKSWQCGPVVYTGKVIPYKPPPPPAAVQFPPNGRWHYFRYDANKILFINEPRLLGDNVLIWAEDYNAVALAESTSERSGVDVTALGFAAAPEVVRRVAEEIVSSDPGEIGNLHHVRSRPQKVLYEIDCSAMQMRMVQTIDPRGRVTDDLALGARWFAPNRALDTRWHLIQAECTRISY